MGCFGGGYRDGAGRGNFGNSRGNNSDRGRGFQQGGNNLVWKRDPPEGSGNTSATADSGPVSSRPEDLWGAAAAARAMNRKPETSKAGGGGNFNSTFVAVTDFGGREKPGSGKEPSCLNCNGNDHFTASYPTIRCERCKKLGHIRQICQAVLPWECVPYVCGIQSPGLGFFYIPNACVGKQIEKKSSYVVINVIEGTMTTKEIEKEFNDFFGPRWRCTARAISPNQFTMRFPNPKEVERAIYYGQHMKLKSGNAILRLSA